MAQAKTHKQHLHSVVRVKHASGQSAVNPARVALVIFSNTLTHPVHIALPITPLNHETGWATVVDSPPKKIGLQNRQITKLRARNAFHY